MIEPLIAAHHGRLVQVVGDGLLVEFASVVDAVLCAVEVQEAVAADQAAAPPDRQVRYRIGVNLGDMVADGEFILGDGVNVAARLEQLCEPGGVLVSDTVREHVGNKLSVVFDYIGPLNLKNIGRPVGAHRVQPPGKVRPAVRALPAGEAVAKPSVAVLPFANLTCVIRQPSICKRIPEALLIQFSQS